jgi:hypothetical protein
MRTEIATNTPIVKAAHIQADLVERWKLLYALNIGAIAQVRDLAARLREYIDPKRSANVGDRLRLLILDGYTCCISDPVDGVERRHDRGRIDSVAHAASQWRREPH